MAVFSRGGWGLKLGNHPFRHAGQRNEQSKNDRRATFPFFGKDSGSGDRPVAAGSVCAEEVSRA